MSSFKLVLFVALSCGSSSYGAGPSVEILPGAKPSADSAARELIAIEAFKLLYGAAKADPVVEFAPGTSLDPAFRDRLEKLERDRLGQLAAGKDLRPKGPLTLSQVLKALAQGDPITKSQKEELLSTLRLQDLKTVLPGTVNEKARALLIEELTAWARDGQVPVIPANLKAALVKALKDEALRAKPPRVLTDAEIEEALKIPSKVAALAAGLSPNTFSLIDWMQLAGGMRIAGRTDRPNGSFADLRRELGERLAVVGPQRQSERGIQTPRIPFQAPRPSFQVGSAPCPAPKAPGGERGFAPPQNFRGNGGSPGKGGLVQLDAPIPNQIGLDEQTRKRLLADRDRGQLSLPLITHYPKSGASACQVTLIGNPGEAPTPVGEGKCAYNAITARHCVEDDSGERFSHAEIPAFSEMSFTRLEVDEQGGDLAMMAFEAQCRNDLPMAPLAIMPPREGEGILVHAAIPLIGQATSNGGNETRLMMNVRDPENGGVGIEHGNSGGAVLNERGEIVGVISTKLEGSEGVGVGFFASRDALYFANKFLNPEFEAMYLSGVRNPGRGPASIAGHN